MSALAPVAPVHQSQSKLFQLPSELRTQIWALVVEGYDTAIDCDTTPTHYTCRLWKRARLRGKGRDIRAFLSTCRQIYQEVHCFVPVSRSSPNLYLHHVECLYALMESDPISVKHSMKIDRLPPFDDPLLIHDGLRFRALMRRGISSATVLLFQSG
ncbi:MAG: hypothetical protein M1834_002544 [Cirrosporium novae-zelandiae]|nr:MAG: hypothetical protein M1834_002544 [Cirrosporium novae-zelandiae]